MKKLFIVILSLLLIITLCSCRAKTTKNPNISQEDSNTQSGLANEDPTEKIVTTNSTIDVESSNSYRDYHDAWTEFSSYVTDNSSKEETVKLYQSLVLNAELQVFDYFTPLLYWGETLDDKELAEKDITISMLTTVRKSFLNIDLQRESDNKYTTTIETSKEKILIQVEYYPNKDTVRLVAESNGEHALLFEYAKIKGGYAAQYYYNRVVGSTYGGEQKKAMCLYKIMFSGKDGSAARFDDVGEPASLIDGVPGEKEFIDGATHWLTVKDGKFTGELNGTAF